MQKVTLKVLAALSLVAIVLVACNKDQAISPDQLVETQDFAPVIKYSSNVIPGSYIVVYKKNTGKSLVNKPWAEAQVEMRDFSATKMLAIKAEPSNIHQVYSKTLGGFAANLSEPQLEKLRLDPDVDYIEQDQMIGLAPPPGKGPGNGGGGGGSAGQELPWGIERVNGGVSGATGTAWVIDSGIDLDHPDLNVDAARSQTFLNKGDADDQNGHGTHVAGTIAAIDNSIGVIGVAAGATVVAVRVLDRRGSGSTSGVMAGVDYVGANAASTDVANMSLGGGFSKGLNDAVIAASGPDGCNCPFALAAGNESTSATTKSPASANGPNIYTISSMAFGDNWSSFSNYGNPPVDYCEPGSSIYSTYKNGGYATLSGTSMAAPHAAGILLLGNISGGGTVSGDPDGNPDTIGVH